MKLSQIYQGQDFTEIKLTKWNLIKNKTNLHETVCKVYVSNTPGKKKEQEMKGET